MQDVKKLKDRVDPIWDAIRQEVEQKIQLEPLLASFLQAAVLAHGTLEQSLSLHLAHKLGAPTLTEVFLRDVIDDSMAADASIGASIRADLQAFRERDPACARYSVPLLYFKGFHALEAHRIGHFLWHQGRSELALYLQSRVSEVFAVDIHPAAEIGSGILLDHATGLVIGETAVVEDHVSLLHEVTLGGTGKATGDRHPKVRSGVLIGAGAKILGNVEIGEGAKVAAGSMVLNDVPAHCTVAGVPAQPVGECKESQPALEMNQGLGEQRQTELLD
jgi:serine O-acetyltransferase